MIQDITLLRSPEYQKKLAQCIHCGLCLQACPTYLQFGTEMDAPRGRIALMRAAYDERLELEDIQAGFSQHINLCLACRSCETACPSGVQYGTLVESARVVVERNRRIPPAERLMRWLGIGMLMPYIGRIRWAARCLKLYQVVGLQRIVRRLNFLPPALKAMEGQLPPLNLQFASKKPLDAKGTAHGKVLFFTGCIQEGFLSQVNRATERILQRNGYSVIIPPGQTCCGAAHLHLGDLDAARELARKNIDSFLDYGDHVVAVISNAGGCGLSLKEYPHLLAGDPVYADKARRFASMVQDINEFLVGNLKLQPTGAVPKRAVYSDSCHLRHGQKVVKQPRELLKLIPGLELVELEAPDQCCGSAGVYNISQAETAERILDAKMMDIAAVGAELVITTNTGCHLQLLAGVRRAGLQVQVMHVVEVLDLSYHRAEERETPGDKR